MFPQNELMLERISRISHNMNNSYTNNYKSKTSHFLKN